MAAALAVVDLAAVAVAALVAAEADYDRDLSSEPTELEVRHWDNGCADR
jgi:hypothetical protein